MLPTAKIKKMKTTNLTVWHWYRDSEGYVHPRPESPKPIVIEGWDAEKEIAEALAGKNVQTVIVQRVRDGSCVGKAVSHTSAKLAREMDAMRAAGIDTRLLGF